MSIQDWPKSEQPREKLLLMGATALSDAELLAIFLRTGVAGKSAVGLSRDLINQYGGIRPLLNADLKTFCTTKGLGKTKFVQMQAALEISKRYLNEQLKRGDALTNPDETRRYFKSKLRDQAHEVFACLFLDAANRVIQYEELFFGSINSTAVHPRQVLKRALFHNANAVIVAHNHPSGISNPSSADQAITRRLKDALELVDIRLLDHLIIGDGATCSMAELGMI